LKLGNYILSFTFLIFIGSLFFGVLVRGENEVLDLEKRKAQSLPDLNIGLDQFPIQFENFVNDQLLFRNDLIRIKSLISVFIFKNSPFPEKVSVGKDNWLFLKVENSLKIYKSDTLYTQQELELLAQLLNQKKNWLELKGIKFYLLIAPSKPEIYPEYVSEKWMRDENNIGIYEQIYKFLKDNTELNLVFPRKELLDYKENKQLYYKFDTHWNSIGAWVAYSKLIDEIKLDFPEINPPLKQHEISYSKGIKGDFDLLRMINIPDLFTEEFEIPTTMNYSPAIKLDRPDYAGLSIFPGEFYINKQATDLKLLMFRDSYAVDLIPYTSCHFSKSTYIWSPLMLWQTIYYEKPDVVVLQVTQRRISDLFIPNDSVITNQIVPKKVF